YVYGNRSLLMMSYTRNKTCFSRGIYEKDSTGSTTHEYCYIAGGSGLAAVYITTNGSGGAMYYIGSDHQGSINMLIDNTGAIAQYNGQAQEYSYDSWGRRRNPNDWSYNNVPNDFLVFRGFTGHEHLDVFKLINMNGRMYDPVLARFLSPDVFIQGAANTQSFNRYTYCLNNPLKYVDPSGWQYYSDYYDYGGRHPYSIFLAQIDMDPSNNPPYSGWQRASWHEGGGWLDPSLTNEQWMAATSPNSHQAELHMHFAWWEAKSAEIRYDYLCNTYGKEVADYIMSGGTIETIDITSHFKNYLNATSNLRECSSNPFSMLKAQLASFGFELMLANFGGNVLQELVDLIRNSDGTINYMEELPSLSKISDGSCGN
ncbi:MAG: RHS repeat-associated core domain-containing protein, partial [Clostridiales bacterium]|nr:RHS repeat-associated core domain-containing protein [Clostridiales bacterium]